MRSLVLALALAPCAAAAAAQAPDAAREVFAAESAFARSMAARDTQAFAQYVSTEAVFVGRLATLRGRPAVIAGWQRFFEGPTAPFSWAPETVEVLSSGTLALSSGPVLDTTGRRTGTFSSIWRKEEGGRWRVVFDKGCPACDCGR